MIFLRYDSYKNFSKSKEVEVINPLCYKINIEFTNIKNLQNNFIVSLYRETYLLGFFLILFIK